MARRIPQAADGQPHRPDHPGEPPVERPERSYPGDGVRADILLQTKLYPHHRAPAWCHGPACWNVWTRGCGVS